LQNRRFAVELIFHRRERKMDTKIWVIAGGVVLVAIAGISEFIRRDNLLNKKFIILKQKENDEKGKSIEKEGNQINMYHTQDNQDKKRKLEGLHLEGLISGGKRTKRDPEKPQGKLEGKFDGINPFSNKPRENRPNENKTQIIHGSIEKPNRDLKKLRDNIEALKKEYWKEQEDYFLKEAEFRLYKNLFLDEAGLLHYIQRLIGFIHYDFYNKNDLTYLKLKIGDQLIDGINSVLTINMKKIDDPFMFVLPDDLRVPITEEAFYNNLNMNSVEADYEKLLTMKQTIENKKAYLNETRILMLEDENNQFYKKLWIDIKDVLLEMIKYQLEHNLEKSNTVEEIYNDMVNFESKLTKVLENNDIRLSFYENLNEDDRKTYYSILKSADNTPAIIRNDNNLLCKGKITRAKLGNKDKK
jgi:hypothetical protein